MYESTDVPESNTPFGCTVASILTDAFAPGPQLMDFSSKPVHSEKNQRKTAQQNRGKNYKRTNRGKSGGKNAGNRREQKGKFCGNCGAGPTTDRFCSECGKKLIN